MNSLRVVRALLMGAGCVGLLLPGSLLQAASPPRRPVRSKSVTISDVELDAGGQILGLVMDTQGVPVRDAKVDLLKDNNLVASGTSDGLGRFRVGPMPGGVYAIRALGRTSFIRAWRLGTAPPAAGNMALVVVGDDLVRGQMPLENFFASDAFVITALVAAAIAVPIAIHNSSSHKSPASP